MNSIVTSPAGVHYSGCCEASSSQLLYIVVMLAEVTPCVWPAACYGCVLSRYATSLGGVRHIS